MTERAPFSLAREAGVPNKAPVAPRKAKRERPPVLMHRRGHTLLPHGPMDLAALDGFDPGKPLSVAITQPRHIKRHRLYWAMVSLIRDNIDTPIAVETLHEAMKVRLGLTITVKFKRTTVVVPGSTAFHKMDEPAFRRFLDSFMDVVRADIIPGIDKADFERQAREMMGDDRWET